VAHTPRREQRPSFCNGGSGERCFRRIIHRPHVSHRACSHQRTISPGAFKNATTETAVLAS
jgi:hypothetical protein